MDKKRIRISIKGEENTGAYGKIIAEHIKNEVIFSDDSIRSQIDSLSYDEMKLASGLSANLINGVRVVPNTDSPAVNALLRNLKEQDRNYVLRTTQYINRAIVRKNEAENKPTGDTKKIFKEMMDF